MQKEDLLKRLRLVVTITTVAFAVLIVTLLIQFGFIAHYHTQINKLQDDNVTMQEEIQDLQDQNKMYQKIIDELTNNEQNSNN